MIGTAGKLRLDRALTLHLFGPLRRLSRREDNLFPILMYHSITRADERHIPPYYRLNTPPETFARQMRCLKENGYRVLGLGQALEKAAEGNLPKCAVITFDDGFQDFYTQAFPILSQYGFTATVFLPTGYIGPERRNFHGRECLDWSQVRELHRAGIQFGSHTVTHPQLQVMTRELVREEVHHSVAVIADHLGAPVEAFSYPYRFPETDRPFTDFLRSLLAEAGCRYGVSTRIGRSSSSDERYFLRRLPVNSADDMRLFQAKLAGDYDWLRYLQRAHKYLHP